MEDRTKLTHHRAFIGIQLAQQQQLTKENMECHVIPTQQTTGSTKSDSLSPINLKCLWS
jgi:hypothetical protein